MKNIITAEECIPCNNFEDITGFVVVVNADILKDEYQTIEHQLIIPTGGFGTRKNSSGNAVFAKEIFTGEKIRWERYDLLGVLKDTAFTYEIIDKLKEIGEI